MMRKRENPHHSIWAKFLVWRCATYKPYSCSHAAGEQRFACHLQTLQLFPRSRKTDDFLATYNPTVSQLFPHSSVQSKPSAFANPVQFSCKFGDSSFLLQLFPRSRKTLILFATYKPYSQSVVPTQFSSVKTMRICKPCSVQFSCKFGDWIVLLLTNPTVVPTQQKNIDFPATYKPYSCSHAAEKQKVTSSHGDACGFPKVREMQIRQ